MRKSTFTASAVLVGTVIGAGIFGIPFALSKVGLLIGFFYILIIGLVNLLILLAYGEVIERSRGDHQMAGYAEMYLGKAGKNIAALTMLFGNIGALLIYMIGIGDFSYALFSPTLGGSPFVYALIFFILASLAILVGLNLIVVIEKVMVVLLIGIVILFLLIGFPEIKIENLAYSNFGNIFFPYGILLFSFGGVTAISEMRRVLKDKSKFRRAIVLGLSIPFVIYLLFSLVVVGVSGTETTPEAVIGLQNYLGGGVTSLGAILGILTMGTSFLTLGIITKKLLVKDYKLDSTIAWVLTCFIPFFIYLAGLKDFIEVISIIGAVMGGMNGILVLMMYKKAKKMGQEKPNLTIKIPSLIYYLLFAIFGLGIVYEIVFVILK
ncbi:amino acid permease [Patescibacteria group bacterium]|nr:amino acid permease [Patescibacteria group bacterium]